MRSFLRFIKNLLVSLLRRLPVPSTIVGPPKDLAPVEPWVAEFNGRSPPVQAAFLPIHPATRVNHVPPPTGDAKLHWKFQAALHVTHPGTFVARIPRGRVWGIEGAVLTPDDRLLAETAREFGRTAAQNSVFQQFKLCPVRHLPGRIAVLATPGSQVYFHWMFDLLPRWELLRLAGVMNDIDGFVINHRSLPFQVESLAALGLSPEKIIVADDHWKFHVRADELVVPALPAPLDTVSHWSGDFLRRIFLPAGTAPARRRLYLSRKQAPARRVTNEAEVFAVLTPLGFEECVLEGMSLTAQAALFAGAECVVAPHGAGLTNLVFCAPGTKVIDLFSPRWVNPCYWILGQTRGLAYHYLLGRGERPPEHVDPVGKGDDIEVAIGSLRQTLRLASIT